VQEKDNVVIGKPGVALRHFFANKNLDPRIKSVDLHVIFGDSRLLGSRGCASNKHRKQCHE